MKRPPAVAVFDAELPTGLAFIRSLGRAGVPFIAYSSDDRAMGRRSRYTTDFRPCPSVQATDEFVPWLLKELSINSIDLVAPTSDYVAFNVAEANVRSGRPAGLGHPAHGRLLDCLFKDRFATAMSAVGFPTPATAAPTSVESALEFAEAVGYPVVMKPRSHVAVGVNRGMVLTSPHDVRAAFGPYPVGGSQSVALNRDANLAWPILQQFMDLADVDVLSVTGCLDGKG